MNFLNRMERKFGRFGIRELPAIIIGLYAAGYLLSVIAPNVLYYLTLDPYYIVRGQIWRLVTWIIVPPGALGIFTIIMLFFYFSIARALQATWGAFRFTFYYVSGMIFSIIAAFILYAFYRVPFGGLFSTYYINMSIFLAFAVSYPEMEVLLYFIIPVKMKWMGLLYCVLIVYSFIQSSLPVRVSIIASLLNFLIFFLMTRQGNGGFDFRQYRRQQQFKAASGAQKSRKSSAAAKTGVRRSSGSGAGPGAAPIHRCAVCGRTEKDDPNLEFRYCSKCDGAYEYCQDHLFTHKHVKL